MEQEVITTGSTVEAAVAAGAQQLGVPVANVEYEVLEAPKKGFLGFGEVDAKVRVYSVGGADITALRFVNTLIDDLGLDAEAALCPDTISNGDRMIAISGEDAGILIGHHGDTLEALQYLINLAANRKSDEDGSEHIKMTLDIENYRARREQTLRRLARGVAAKVQRFHREVTLEPMSPYERRIIHSEIQNIRGVTTNSIGVDNNRRVVVSWEDPRARRRSDRPARAHDGKPTDAQDKGEAPDTRDADEIIDDSVMPDSPAAVDDVNDMDNMNDAIEDNGQS